MAGARRRKLTDADKRAAAKVRDLWADYKARNPGISQEIAAARADMSQSAFSQFVRGTMPMRVSPVVKLARLFGVKPADIRPDLASLPYSLQSESTELKVSEPPSPRPLSAEALEIARAFDLMGPQTQARVREHVFIYSIIDRSFPWLRTGKPVGSSYDKFEKNHEDNMRAQLALEAARIENLRKG